MPPPKKCLDDLIRRTSIVLQNLNQLDGMAGERRRSHTKKRVG
jgi:hypothetical protein